MKYFVAIFSMFVLGLCITGCDADCNKDGAVCDTGAVEDSGVDAQDSGSDAGESEGDGGDAAVTEE